MHVSHVVSFSFNVRCLAWTMPHTACCPSTRW